MLHPLQDVGLLLSPLLVVSVVAVDIHCLCLSTREKPAYGIGQLRGKLLKLSKFELVVTKSYSEIWLKIHEFMPISAEVKPEYIREPVDFLDEAGIRDGLKALSRIAATMSSSPLVDELVEMAQMLSQVQVQTRQVCVDLFLFPFFLSFEATKHTLTFCFLSVHWRIKTASSRVSHHYRLSLLWEPFLLPND